MKTRLVSITPEAEKLIAYCARVSNPKNQSNDNITRLLQYCIQNGHWSIFEVASMVVEIDTSRGLAPQLSADRSFSFQEFNQRYAAVDETSGLELYAARRKDTKNRQNSFDDLPESIKREWEQRQATNWINAFEHYAWAINHDIADECARFVLPLGTSTRLYMSGTIRSWIHYIQVRSAPEAQKEHRDIALSIRDTIFVPNLPIISSAVGWPDP